MLGYATPAERAEWEAAGRPELDQGTWKRALAAAYVLVVSDDAGGLIGPDGQPWQDDGRTVIDLDYYPAANRNEERARLVRPRPEKLRC